MSDTATIERNCKTCGKPVIETKSRFSSDVVHVGGGAVEQKCNNPACGWKGGMAGKFSSCPSCGDATNLVDTHIAS